MADPICSRCGLPIAKPLHYLGFLQPHDPDECVRLLKERASRGEARLAEAVSLLAYYLKGDEHGLQHHAELRALVEAARAKLEQKT